ncbi:trehalose 6-phosphate synthase/phosphatase [Catalinimonas alkaloidigena]|uniref:Alpha,alpha-trehalose-phosphate synthase n=1 Tax=Catalinimonas alkaloidigena TaxID=1075417 RepID=A0A1G9EWP9_9BACT|nr:bifunctional alpha,alpha-trehalose-phosphate synthase (UDP-forming)/trehalose-phosphatase [Catalinimonas alkaloidigena]SDK80617.1 trehalose 6-phosphate synthase/phosphatase [Catalinimonas alkaloidigena]
MSRLITISNRLPISLVRRDERYEYTPSAGGLATGLKSFHGQNDNLWIGWPGMEIGQEEDQREITDRMKKDKMHPVFLTESDIEDFYEGFSNKTLWPLFHYFNLFTDYSPYTWERYVEVNQKFADEIFKVARPDDVFWVHDYQLMLLPALIRERFPHATIGFFLHIPFPSYEMFRSLPWRRELLNGMLGADLIGFHTYDYVRHFLSAVKRILDVDHSLGRIKLGDRVIDVDSFPMGIDYKKFANSIHNPTTIREVVKFRNNFNHEKIILSIDRLDYSKGIYQRLEAYDTFLSDHPEYQKKVALITVVVPSRGNVDQYQKLKVQLDEAIGRINGKYSTPEWTAIHYYYRSLPFETLTALYYCADIALITPFRDGMNLIAKEYVATKTDQQGVLILSEMAGAAKELTEALFINPNDIQGISDALHDALNMPSEEQRTRMQEMQSKVERYDVKNWAELFIDRMYEARSLNTRRREKHWNEALQQELIKKYKKTHRRLFLIGYDGTLVKFTVNPLSTRSDNELRTLLSELGKDPDNKVVVISGRDKSFLEEQLKGLPVDMIAEHGVWGKRGDDSWQILKQPQEGWKDDIRSILDSFVDRTPGSFIEEKEYSLAWHYRVVDSGLGEMRVHELTELLSHRVAALNLQVIEGKKVIEIKTSGISKGTAAKEWLDSDNWDLVLAIGDDYTDEDVFRETNAEAYTLRVGYQDSIARFHIDSVEDVRKLLRALNLASNVESHQNGVHKTTTA